MLDMQSVTGPRWRLKIQDFECLNDKLSKMMKMSQVKNTERKTKTQKETHSARDREKRVMGKKGPDTLLLVDRDK